MTDNVAEPITFILEAVRRYERYRGAERQRIDRANAVEARRANLERMNHDKG